ncbi:MAG: dephospho-CoA kinase [Planctomycetaceae bacterium]|jgi:dephospho-CoA kinase|nr:dephospho-CoA kinase [Planctomycetaceae bacterium]
MIFGLVGGIGCGKSLVAGLFSDFGAGVIDADAIGHGLLEDAAIMKQIRKYFGNDIFCDINGASRVDRRKLASIVFDQTESGTNARNQLNSILHPPIAKIINKKIVQLEKNYNFIVLDAPLLIETGFDKVTDKIVFIDAARKIRLERILKRKWTEYDLNLREATQLPLEKKRQRANYIINNNKTIEYTKKQVKIILDEIRNFS